MKRTTVFLAAIAFWALCSSAHAISFGGPGGKWPKSWPEELEPLRKQAWTWEHGFGGMSYDIPFASREEFESAWPHILQLKSKGAPITLMRGSHVRVDPPKTAGVRIMLPPEITPAEAEERPAKTPDAANEPPSTGRSAEPSRAADREATPARQLRDKSAAPTDRPAAAHAPPAAPGKTAFTQRLPGVGILLVVDGDIVDLNRIPLPADTPIIDKRFDDGQNQSPNRSGD